MMNLGAGEMLLLGILALVLFGPRRLPELGKALGEGLAAFRESSRQLSHEFRRQLEEETSPPAPVPAIPAEVLLPPQAGPVGMPMGAGASLVSQSEATESVAEEVETDRTAEEVPAPA